MIAFADALALFFACLAAMASPGPGVAALVARAAVAGVRGSLPFIAGMVAGDLVLFAVAVAGMAGLQAWADRLLPPLLAVAGLWLLWMAGRQWRSAAVPPAAARSGGGSFMAAWLLTIGNPKVIVFYLALLPAVMGPWGLRPGDVAMAALIVVTTLAAVMLAYAWLARAAAGLLAHPATLRRVCAAVMAGVGLLLLARGVASVA